MIDIKPLNMQEKNPVSLTPIHAPAQRGKAAQEENNVEPDKASGLAGLKELVDDVQRNMNWIHDVNLQFSVHQASGRIMVTVRDESTGEVVREIPPSELLDLSSRIEEMIGLIFNEKG